MACFHPLPAYRDREGGQPRIGYHAGESGDKLELPCGRCIGCKRDRSLAWSIRCTHEASLYDGNSFLTLTYAPEHLPASLSLEYPHFQAFMKRLRKHYSGISVAPNGKAPIRFFAAGEYGENFGRPHWHALLFNFRFPDSVRYHNDTYHSASCEALWRFGQVVIGDVTPASAAYVAGYTQGKVYGSLAEDHYEDVVNVATGELTRRRAEFAVMSRRPGIGAWWYQKYSRDLLPNDFAVLHGKRHKVPRYYWEKFRQELDHGQLVESIEWERLQRARAVDPAENSERRRNDREQVALSRTRIFSGRGRFGV